MSSTSTRRLHAVGAACALALLAACGGTSSGNNSSGLPAGFYISISGMAYSPLQLQAPPGATVTVINNDPMEHTVTSEAAAGDFTFGAVAGVSFDKAISGGTHASFTLPADAPDGTVIPFYCRVHTSTMATPNGSIKVNAAAMPSPAPGGGGGGGGY